MSMQEAGTGSAFKEAGSTDEPGPYTGARALDWRALSANRCPVDGEDLSFFEHINLARCKIEACGFWVSLLLKDRAARENRFPSRGYGFGSHHAHTPF